MQAWSELQESQESQKPQKPKRAINYEDLDFNKSDSGMHNDGANKPSACNFVGVDGKRYEGFYKPLSDKYSEFLALMSVLASIFCRMMLGEKAAEDMLVIKNGRVVGTLSRKVPGLTFTYWNETPVDPEQQTPSTETLLKNNFIEILLAMHVYANDDGHPHNVGLLKLFDWDLYLSGLTEVDKGSRLISNKVLQGIDPVLAPANRDDFANFPDAINVYSTHSPTYDHPKNLNLEKGYARPDQFRALAANPKTLINGKEVCAQEQLGIATLKLLMTRQHSRMERLLKDYFGNIPLNYKQLSEDKARELERRAPFLFSNKTNGEPFRLFGKAYHDFIYDCFYRTTVFFEGVPKNRHGVPVPAFNDWLSIYPGMYQTVIAWMEEQNKEMDAAETSMKAKKEAPLPGSFFSPPPLQPRRSFHISSVVASELLANPFEDLKFDIKTAMEIYQRAHRDSFAPEMRGLFKKVLGDINRLVEKEIGSTSPGDFIVYEDMDSLDFELKKSVNFFGKLKYHPLENLKCDKNSVNREVIGNMITLHKDWYQAILAYYDEDTLTTKDSNVFKENLGRLNGYSLREILEKVGPNVSWAQEWSQSMDALEDLRRRMCFWTHITKVAVPAEKAIYKVLDYKDPDTVNACIVALFAWLKTRTADELDIFLKAAVDEYNRRILSSAWWNDRAPKVRNIIQTTRHLSGDQRVAQILCVPRHEEGDMNEKVVLELLKNMLQSEGYRANIEFKEVWDALQAPQLPFDIGLYNKTAVRYCSENYFPKPSKNSVTQVNQYFFNWIVQAFQNNREVFKTHVQLAEKEYLDGKYTIAKFWTNRSSDIQKLNFNTPMKELVCTIFSEGGWEENSFNTKLYNHLIVLLRTNGKQQNYSALEFQEICGLPNQYATFKPYYEEMKHLIKAMKEPVVSNMLEWSPAPGY